MVARFESHGPRTRAQPFASTLNVNAAYASLERLMQIERIAPPAIFRFHVIPMLMRVKRKVRPIADQSPPGTFQYAG
jgi:hypothetical protein